MYFLILETLFLQKGTLLFTKNVLRLPHMCLTTQCSLIIEKTNANITVINVCQRLSTSSDFSLSFF